MEGSIDNSRRTLVTIANSYEITNSFIEKILTDEISRFDEEERKRFNQCGMMLTEFLDQSDFEKTPIFKTGIKAASSLSYATGGEQTPKEQFEYSIVLLVLYLWDDIVSENEDVNKEQLVVLSQYFGQLIAENITPPLEAFEGDILSLAKLVIHINNEHEDLLKDCNMNEFITGTIRDKDIPEDLNEYWDISEMSCYRGVLNCFKHLSNRQSIQRPFDYELYKIGAKMICIINDFASYEKEKEENCYLNAIIVSDKTHDDGKEFIENYLSTIIQDFEHEVEYRWAFDKESSMVMLCWVLGYLRFEKLREDMRNKKRAENSKV